MRVSEGSKSPSAPASSEMPMKRIKTSASRIQAPFLLRASMEVNTFMDPDNPKTRASRIWAAHRAMFNPRAGVICATAEAFDVSAMVLMASSLERESISICGFFLDTAGASRDSGFVHRCRAVGANASSSELNRTLGERAFHPETRDGKRHHGTL